MRSRVKVLWSFFCEGWVIQAEKRSLLSYLIAKDADLIYKLLSPIEVNIIIPWCQHRHIQCQSRQITCTTFTITDFKLLLDIFLTP